METQNNGGTVHFPLLGSMLGTLLAIILVTSGCIIFCFYMKKRAHRNVQRINRDIEMNDNTPVMAPEFVGNLIHI